MAVLFIVTNWDKLGETGKPTGTYLPEVAHPHHVFKEAGFEMTFCSPNGGASPIDPTSIEMFKEDPVCKTFLADQQSMALLANTTAIKDIDASKFNIVFYAGGHGPMWDCVDNADLQNATTKVYEAGGIVSAVCHGTVGLVNVKLSDGTYLISGKKVTSFTNEEEEMIQLTAAMPFLLETKLGENGGDFVAGAAWQPNVVVSDRVITGQNPASASGMAEAVVKHHNST